jgi:UrcA family protein
MKTFLKAVSIAAGVSMTLLAGVGSSAQAEEIHIRVADLNLNSPADTVRFDQRVDAAAREMCANYEPMRRNTCLTAVRQEAKDKLAQQQAQLARQNGVAVASARP